MFNICLILFSLVECVYVCAFALFYFGKTIYNMIVRLFHRLSTVCAVHVYTRIIFSFIHIHIIKSIRIFPVDFVEIHWYCIASLTSSDHKLWFSNEHSILCAAFSTISRFWILLLVALFLLFLLLLASRYFFSSFGYRLLL